MASFFSNPTVQQQSLASQRRVVCGQIPLFIENFLMFVNFLDNNVVCVILVTEKITRLYKRRWMVKGDDSNRLLLAIAKRLSTSNRRYRCSYITTLYYSAFILVASITFNIVYLKNEIYNLFLELLCYRMKLKEAEAEERRKELIKKRQTAVMTLKASFAANQVQLISRMCFLFM